MASSVSAPHGACPCGSAKPYTDCCARYHQGDAMADTAETLMRSRYSAYVFAREDYLLSTWHSSTRPAALNLADEPATKWLGLKVVQTQNGRSSDSEGRVEFVARYKVNGKAYKLHEVSRFIKEAGQWFYVSGEILA